MPPEKKQPTREQLEEALRRAHDAGETDHARTLAQAIRDGAYAEAPGINVTPAPADNPATRTSDVLQQADQFVDETQRIEGRAMQRDIERAGSDMQVVRHPQTGEPYQRAFLSDPAVARGPGFEQLQDSSELAQGAAAINGNFLGAGGELAGLMNPDLPFAKQGFDEAYARAYEENPALAMALEMGGSAGPLMLGGAVGMGPRTAGAVEGGVYGFNDPFVGGEGLESRALNAAGGALTGRVLGGIGAGSKNQLDRQINTWSGVDTIQRVADEEFGITLTEGQIKGDPALRAVEDSARKGSLGSESANRAGRESFQAQNEAATRAARALGGDTYSEANQAAEAAARGIRSRIDQRRGEITEAYDRAASYGAEMSEEGVRGLPNAVVDRLERKDLVTLANVEDGVTEASMYPALKSAIGSIRRMSEAAGERGGSLEFVAIEEQRQHLNDLIGGAKNPKDRAAVIRLKNAYDRAIDDAVDNALFNGNSAFISAYRDARELNAKFQREWGANKVFERIVEREARPEEVINFILGGSRVAGDKNYDVLLQLKGALEEDPEAWQALQEAYVKKTFNQLPKDFGPQRTLQLLDEMLVGRNQSFSQILFDDDQYQQMRRFRSVVESMVPPDGSINYSNSGVMLQRMRTSANDMMTGLHATPGVRAIGRTIMGALDKFGVETQGRRVKRQLNPPRGLDTRRIESGFPEERFTPRAADLPGAGAGAARQPRSLQEGIEQAARGEPTTTSPSVMAQAMNGPQQAAPQRPVFGRRAPEPEVPPQAPPGPPSRVTEPIPESAYGGGPRNAERMNIPKEPTTLTSAVRNLGGIKTRYTSEGVQKNLSRGDFEGIPGLINDRSGKGADDMVRALQEDGFDIANEDDLYRALDNERMGVKTYRIGEGEAYEMELDSYEAMLAGDDPVQNGIPDLRGLMARLMGNEDGTLLPKVFKGGDEAASDALPMDEASRLARAREMGFDTDAYHGTGADITQFDPARAGSVTRARSARLGTWLVDDPNTAGGYARYATEDKPVQDLINASYAAERNGNWDEAARLMQQAETLEQRIMQDGLGRGANIMPVKVRGNIKKIDMQGAKYDPDDTQLTRLAEEAKAEGYDGVTFQNFVDNVDYSDYSTANHTLVFDPKNIRSKYAKFDPELSDSPIITNGLPSVKPDEPRPKIRMQNADGRPTTIGKIYELSKSVNPETGKLWTRAEIADEMMISRNQVSVTMSKLRSAGYDAEVAGSVSQLGYGQKTQMAVELKRQGLSNREIANRINAVYGKDVVHGGTDTTEGAVSVLLSQARGKKRGNGEVVDFGMGLALPTAAASMMLTEGESSEEQLETILGTDEEKRAAMARAMLGGF